MTPHEGLVESVSGLVRDRPLIVHVIHRLSTGGMENGVVNLLNNLPAGGYRHAVISLTDVDSFSEKITDRLIPLYRIGKRAGKDPAAYFRLWRLLRSLQADLVHTRNLATVECQLVARAAGILRGIHGEHGWGVEDLHGANARNRRIRRLCRGVVDRYVAVSAHIREYLINSIGADPQHVIQIPNGVDTGHFRPRAAADATPGLFPNGFADGDAFVIGTVGRLEAVKNQTGLLDAMQQLIEAGTEASKRLRLVIVGDGPERARLQARINALGLDRQVWLAGLQADTAAFYRQFDLFVLPSLAEGMANTLLEAMSSGLPVVATRVGGNPELVVDGETGVLIEPDNSRELVAAILACLERPERNAAFGDAGRQRVLPSYGLDVMVDAYHHLYLDVLKGRGN